MVYVQCQKVRVMKDAFGYHRVSVYTDVSILRKIIELRIKAQAKRQDSIYLVCAPEGGGKSTFCLLAYELFGELTNSEKTIDNVCMNVGELMTRISIVNEKHFLILDEGSELSGDRSMEKKAKEIKEVFTVIRKKANIIFVCFTNPLKAGTYFREDRIRGVFFLNRPGEVWYYPNSFETPKFQNILEIWSKTFKNTKSIKKFTSFAPTFIMYYPEYLGVLREPYEAKKDGNMQRLVMSHSLQKGVKDGVDYNDKTKFLLPSEAGAYLNMHVSTVSRFIQSGRLVPVRLGFAKYIPIEQLDNLLAMPKTFKQSSNKSNKESERTHVFEMEEDSADLDTI